MPLGMKDNKTAPPMPFCIFLKARCQRCVQFYTELEDENGNTVPFCSINPLVDILANFLIALSVPKSDEEDFDEEEDFEEEEEISNEEALRIAQEGTALYLAAKKEESEKTNG